MAAENARVKISCNLRVCLVTTQQPLPQPR
jgi:hypothetical protein